MKNVSILGCGWLGVPLAASLIEKGFSVKGSTTTLEKKTILQSLGIKPYLIDISEIRGMNSFFNSDILIIAITSKSISDFVNLIEHIQNSRIQKVIFISSTSVYPRNNKIQTEQDKVVKNALSEIEELFRKNNFFETTVIRFAGLFGGKRHPSNWFKNGKKIPQPNGFVNMIHQEDCIEIIHRIIYKNCWNTTLNACSNHHPTRKEFYTKANLKMGFEVPEFEENEVYQWKIISSNKLQEKLEYQFIHDNLLVI